MINFTNIEYLQIEKSHQEKTYRELQIFESLSQYRPILPSIILIDIPRSDLDNYNITDSFELSRWT